MAAPGDDDEAGGWLADDYGQVPVGVLDVETVENGEIMRAVHRAVGRIRVDGVADW